MISRARFAALGLAVAVASAAVVFAQSQFIAFEQITVAASAVGFTASKITPTGQQQAIIASCRLETAEVRFRYDGGAPTTTVGTLLEPGESLTVTGHDNLAAFSAIRTGGTSGQLDCTYTR